MHLSICPLRPSHAFSRSLTALTAHQGWLTPNPGWIEPLCRHQLRKRVEMPYRNWLGEEGDSMFRKTVGLLAGLALVYIVVNSLPDVVRYVEISRM